MKEIKDYLHLYLGCQVKTSGGKTCKLVSVSDSTCIIVYPDDDPRGRVIVVEALKPLLRPLSSMTEEEARVILPDMPKEQELMEWGYLNEFADGNVFYQYLARAEDERLSPTLEDSLGVPEHWLFLLSKGFDLFNLIEKGLAIDSTQIKTTNYGY